MLSDREHGYLKRLRWRRRAAIAFGLLLTTAGGLYAIWGAGQFQADLGIEVSQERSVATWDPLARLALLFAPYHERLREAEPETEAERILIGELGEQTTLTARLVVLLIRILFASLVLTAGLILLSNALVTGRLVAMLNSMVEQQQAPGRAER
jgi:hypothetical protein